MSTIAKVSMLNGRLFDKLEEVARIMKKKPKLPFGGIQVSVSALASIISLVADGLDVDRDWRLFPASGRE